MTTSKSKTT